MSNEDLINLIIAKITSGNRSTTAANVREVVTACVNSFQNVDGKDIAEGYLGIDADGRVDVSNINSSATNATNLVLQGDGTWRNSKYGKSTFNGTGAQTTFTVIHNAGFTPDGVIVTSGSQDASIYAFYANNFTPTSFDIVFVASPLLGTGNVVIYYNIT